VAPAKSPAAAVVRPAPDTTAPSASDADAERELLLLANDARARVGVPPLQVDAGLAEAAREHVAILVHKQQLSHQFDGEPPLLQRVSKSTLHLDKAGENVAYDIGVEQAHEGLMHSPPHRANLLNASYNVAGFAVVHTGRRLYVVQDFGHSVPAYPVEKAESIAIGAIQRLRGQYRLPALKARRETVLQRAACSMAQQDRLETHSLASLHRPKYILSYAIMQPEMLTPSAGKAVSDGSVRSLSLGACYGRTATYPNGTYWVAMLFY
jgi:uncharacterized protein YkwD